MDLHCGVLVRLNFTEWPSAPLLVLAFEISRSKQFNLSSFENSREVFRVGFVSEIEGRVAMVRKHPPCDQNSIR
jgi:hypothetical protein